MRLTAVEAALTGAALGSLTTFCTAWFIQRATARREHDGRVWERRRAVYDDTVVVMHRIGRLRDEVEDTGRIPPRPAGAPDPLGDMVPVVARMDIYGTDALLQACEEASEAMDGWHWAWGVWTRQRETNPRRSRTDPLWVKFLDAVQRSKAAESRVIELLRAELHSARPPKWWKVRERREWRQRRN
ncbi:hypothetical protein [Streptomyces sp. WG-D5]